MSLRTAGLATLVAAAFFSLGVRADTRAGAPAHIDLIGVVPPDSSLMYGEADDWLRAYLSRALLDDKRKIKLAIDSDVLSTYGKAIDEVITRTSPNGAPIPFLARMTPYAYVAATMLGAKLDVIGTYQSLAAGKKLTYHSYFAVNKADFDAGKYPPTLDGLAAYLKAAPPAKKPIFEFHDKLSTSSYFLPALWLRGHRIFADAPAGGTLTAIDTQTSMSGSESLRDVAAEVKADGRPRFAAIWDGTKNEFEKNPGAAARVRFIQLPTELPNDLLVCSESLTGDVREALGLAVDNMAADLNGRPTDGSGRSRRSPGDFFSWQGVKDAPEAMQALAALIQQASEPPAPVVVDVSVPSGDARLTEALTKAVRLSRPEFVLYDPDYHRGNWDVRWTLERLPHDNALRLTVQMHDSEDKRTIPQPDSQSYPISFVDAQGDLTARITSLVHSRLPRIRYLWPYRATPTILGDIEFTPENNAALKVQKIIWVNPDRNAFRKEDTFDAQIDDANFFRYQLKWPNGPVPQAIDNPLSSVAYRTVLRPPADRNGWAQPTLWSLLGIFALAALGLTRDLRRKPRVEVPPLTLDAVASRLVWTAHDVWGSREMTDADVLWCSGQRIDFEVEELLAKPEIPIRDLADFGIVRQSWSSAVKFSLPLRVGSAEHERGFTRAIETDFKKRSDRARLATLVRILVRNRQLSGFAWPPVEWEALNRCVTPAFAAAGSGLIDVLKRDSDPVRSLASAHLSRVLDGGLKKLSLFRARWTPSITDGHNVAAALFVMPAGLRLAGQDEINALSPWFEVPNGVDQSTFPAGGEYWMLGTLTRMTPSTENNMRVLKLGFSPIALLQDPAD